MSNTTTVCLQKYKKVLTTKNLKLTCCFTSLYLPLTLFRKELTARRIGNQFQL